MKLRQTGLASAIRLHPRLSMILLYSLLVAGLLRLYVAFTDVIPAKISLPPVYSSIFAHWDMLVLAVIIINAALCFVVVFFIRKMAATACVVPVMLIEFLLMTLAHAAWTNAYQ
jgi:hypothetical protein